MAQRKVRYGEVYKDPRDEEVAMVVNERFVIILGGNNREQGLQDCYMPDEPDGGALHPASDNTWVLLNAPR